MNRTNKTMNTVTYILLIISGAFNIAQGLQTIRDREIIANLRVKIELWQEYRERLAKGTYSSTNPVLRENGHPE